MTAVGGTLKTALMVALSNGVPEDFQSVCVSVQASFAGLPLTIVKPFLGCRVSGLRTRAVIVWPVIG